MSCRVADVTAPLEEVGGGQQLGGRQPDLAGEVVGVPDHGRQDLARPGVPGTGDGGEHLRGDLLTRRRPGRRGGVCVGTVGREIPAVRILAAELEQNGGDGIEDRRVVVADAEVAHFPDARLAGALDGAGRQGDDAVGTFQQDLTGLGEFHPRWRPPEKPDSHVVFEPLYLPGQRRLRHVQPERRAVDVKFLGDGNEAFELPGVDCSCAAGVSDPEDGFGSWSLRHGPPVAGLEPSKLS